LFADHHFLSIPQAQGKASHDLWWSCDPNYSCGNCVMVFLK